MAKQRQKTKTNNYEKQKLTMLAPLQKTRDTMSKYMNKTTVQSNSIDTDIDAGGIKSVRMNTAG